MAKKDKQKNSKFTSSMNKLKTETKHGIWAILFFVLALFLLMSIPAFDMGGVAGKNIYEFLNYFLGIGYILLPLLFVLLGSSFLKSETPNIGWIRAISGIMFLLSGLGMIDVVSLEHSGGFLGRILSTPLVSLFDVYASIIFLGAILIISIFAMFDAKPDLAPFLKNIWNTIMRRKEKPVSTLNEDEERAVDANLASLEAMQDAEEKSSPTEKFKKAIGMKKKDEEEKDEED